MKILSIAIVSLAVLASCSSNPQKPVEPQTEVKSGPEGLPGCFPNEDDQCIINAPVSDGATVEMEVIECDPACCLPGAVNVDGSKDTDKDGLVDERDKCPTEPEDFDDFEDTDGCPDPDNDGDGILDVDDVCPEDAENKNGVEDEDGCPD